MPELYIITGSNGAGKSSVGPSYLPKYIQQSCTVFDGDKLYMEHQKELWASGMRAHKEIKKIALAFVEETFDNLVEGALQTRSDFVYEGHFTNDATWSVPKRFKESGFRIHLLFLGLTSPDLSQLRVTERSNAGGHYVPRNTIEANFFGNLEKLDQYFPMFDSIKIIDSSETNHSLILHLSNSKINYVLQPGELPAWFLSGLPNLITLINMLGSEKS